MTITGWPVCSKCNKPVDKVESIQDPLTDERIFVVSCHGEFEESRLTREQIIFTTSISMDGKAFFNQYLEERNES